MRMSQDEKDRSHERIIASAAKLVREHGIEGASVHDVMTDAGLTHGGFYKHFPTKDALLVSAMEAAFDQMMDRLPASGATAASGSPVMAFEEVYLSEGHVDNPGTGCPVAALAGDIARASLPLRRSFTAGVNRMIDGLARRSKGSEQRRRERAARHLAMMVGAVMIARAADEDTAKSMLQACRM